MEINNINNIKYYIEVYSYHVPMIIKCIDIFLIFRNTKLINKTSNLQIIKNVCYDSRHFPARFRIYFCLLNI